MSVSAYSHLKEQIINSIDEMLTIEAIRGCPCEDLREKIEKNTFNLVVVGQFKRGKTSLINALLGEDILPVAVVPLTSIVTIMTYGEALRIKVYFNDGRVSEIKPESLADYVTEKGNPKNIKDVKEVVITYPSPYLKEGVRLIDTPGVGSIYQHNTDVAYQYLPKSDAAMFLLSVDQPMSKAELDFLNDVKEYSNKIFFLLNKADYLNEKDLWESIEFSKGVLKGVMGADVRLFPVSARLALEAKKCNSQELLQKSRLLEFSDALNRFLMEEKGKILLLSVINNLLRILSQSRFEIELELKSLTVPLEELEKKLSVFEEKKKAVMDEKQDFDILLDGETKRLLRNILDEELDKFKKELIADIMPKLEAYYNENKGLTLRELHKALEDQVIREVKGNFSGWRVLMDERLAKAFETTCKRFIQRIDDIVDELLRFSSELFQIPFDAVQAEALWTVKSGFYYKFKDEPVGLEMLAGKLTLALPKFIGEKIILKKMREYLHQVVDIQSGRIRYDFAERLDKSKLDFRWEMLQRIEATIEGIETAIKKGIEKRERGEEEVEERKKNLNKIMERIDGIRDRLLRIRTEVAD
ncbi:MAG: dynamin family protein [Thermodesulfovibrionales bacterium]